MSNLPPAPMAEPGWKTPRPSSPSSSPLPTPPPAEAPEPVLIPFVLAWLESVDIAARRITMHLPEGLLDTVPNAEELSSNAENQSS
jgi:hypothetical protein